MAIHFRNYNHAEDYRHMDDFLIKHYQPGNADGNWIEPIWEYMHFHPAHDSAARDTIGIWEEGGLPPRRIMNRS